MKAKCMVTVRMPVALHAGLRKLARERECSMEALVRHLVESAVVQSSAAIERFREVQLQESSR